jgi:outer membrane protein TolC
VSHCRVLSTGFGIWRGVKSLIDVLDAERSHRETQRLHITTRADYWRALYLYNSTVGINSVNDMRQ